MNPTKLSTYSLGMAPAAISVRRLAWQNHIGEVEQFARHPCGFEMRPIEFAVDRQHGDRDFRQIDLGLRGAAAAGLAGACSGVSAHFSASA